MHPPESPHRVHVQVGRGEEGGGEVREVVRGSRARSRRTRSRGVDDVVRIDDDVVRVVDDIVRVVDDIVRGVDDIVRGVDDVDVLLLRHRRGDDFRRALHRAHHETQRGHVGAVVVPRASRVCIRASL